MIRRPPSPTLSPSAAPSLPLTADGSNFVSGATVQWNGAARTTTFVSATRLTASIPASDIATAGSAMVTVRNPATQVPNALTFTINQIGCPTGQFFAQYFSNI